MGRALRNVGLALLGVVSALALGEAALRVYLAAAPIPADSPYIPDEHAVYRLRPDPPGSYPGPRSDHINSFGFRDYEHSVAKPPRTYRIIGIGDSFVYGNVPLEDNFLRVAERRMAQEVDADSLAVEMILMGVGGYDLDNEVGILKSLALDLDPDLVVLNFFVGNDVTGLGTPAALHRARLYFVDAPTGPLRVARRSKIFLLAEDLFLRRTTGRLLEPAADEPSETESAGTSPGRAAVSAAGDRVAQVYLDVERKRLPIFRRKVGPRIEELWDRALEYLIEFDRLCAERGVPWVLHVIPSEIQVDPLVADAVFTGLKLDPADYDLERPQGRIRRFAEEHGIVTLDSLPTLRRLHDPKDRLYIPNDTHWSVRGNLVAGTALAEFILEQMRSGRSER